MLKRTLKRGNALTVAITSILVLTLIGVPLLSLVVYNYYFREFALSLKRAEYKNEMIMDRVYAITQNTVVTAISAAKGTAISGVDDMIEIQKDVYDEYKHDYTIAENEWITATQLAGGDVANETKKLADIENALKVKYGITGTTTVATTKFPELNQADGTINAEALQKAYNKAFKEAFRKEISDNLYNNVAQKNEYSNILSNENNMNFSKRVNYAGEGLTVEDSAKVNLVVPSGTEKIIAEVVSEYKAARVTTVIISADFVISVPEFNQVSAIEQKTVTFSNPLINKTLGAGNKLSIASGAHLTINGDMTVGAEVIGSDNPDDGGININGGSLTVNGRLATAEDITLSGNLTTGAYPVYYRNLFLEGTGSTVTFGGDVYARDDLEINAEDCTVTQVSGKNYYGFNDVNDSGPDASSSIIINVVNNTLSKLGSISLGNVYLAGRAFIDGVKSTSDGGIYKTGESISVKKNYLAYQTALSNTTGHVYDAENIAFSTYLWGNSNFTVNMADNFVEAISDFDSNHKWQYFREFAAKNPSSVIKPNIQIENIKYMQGAGIAKVGATELAVVPSTTSNVSEPAFKTNCASDFEAQTNYYGYYPEEESKRKSKIFGEWLKSITSVTSANTDKIYIATGDKTVTATDLANYNVIICSGNITINASGEWSGLMIAGGNIEVGTGSEIIINNNKPEILSWILFGADEANSSLTEYNARNRLYKLFNYDDSGTTYIITKTPEGSLINSNNLIGITNWKKRNWGRI